MGEDEEITVQARYAAMAGRDPAPSRLLLHPDLHRTGADEILTRGGWQTR